MIQLPHRSGDAGLAYRVVSGDRIQTDAPLLFDFYTSADLLQWVRDVTACATSHARPILGRR